MVSVPKAQTKREGAVGEDYCSFTGGGLQPRELEFLVEVGQGL